MCVLLFYFNWGVLIPCIYCIHTVYIWEAFHLFKNKTLDVENSNFTGTLTKKCSLLGRFYSMDLISSQVWAGEFWITNTTPVLPKGTGCSSITPENAVPQTLCMVSLSCLCAFLWKLHKPSMICFLSFFIGNHCYVISMNCIITMIATTAMHFQAWQIPCSSLIIEMSFGKLVCSHRLLYHFILYCNFF